MTIAFPPIADLEAWRAGIRVVMADRCSHSDSLDCITDPRLRRLADYWRSRRAGRVMPARADIDPLDLSWALPYLYLVDCRTDAGPGADGGPWRYRYRLAGEQIEQVFRGRVGRSSVRHVWLDDMVSADALPLVMKRWRPLPESGQILFMQGMVYQVADRFVRGRRLLLPLAERADGPVTGLLGMTLCEWQAPPDLPPDLPEAADIAITHIPVAALS